MSKDEDNKIIDIRQGRRRQTLKKRQGAERAKAQPANKGNNRFALTLQLLAFMVVLYLFMRQCGIQ